MKKVEMFQTYDGERHNSEQAATRHLNNLYAAEMMKIAHCIMARQKRMEFTTWINDNLNRFQYLIDLRRDMRIEEGDE